MTYNMGSNLLETPFKLHNNKTPLDLPNNESGVKSLITKKIGGFRTLDNNFRYPT